NTEEIHRGALPPRRRLPLRPRRHRGHASRCALAVSLSRCRLCDCRNQSQFFANLGLKLGIHFFVIFQELARILTALADALTLVAEPGPGFFSRFLLNAKSSRSPSLVIPSPYMMLNSNSQNRAATLFF